MLKADVESEVETVAICSISAADLESKVDDPVTGCHDEVANFSSHLKQQLPSLRHENAHKKNMKMRLP